MNANPMEWNIEWILKCDTDNATKFSILILNQPILLEKKLACSLWKQANTRIIADGGADRWRHFIQTTPEASDLKPPDMISGDFDSVKKETLNFFKDLGSEIIPTPDQDHTDFTKALMILSDRSKNEWKNVVVVIVETSGRLDQIFANINTLFLAQNSFWRNGSIYLLASQSISWLLHPGRHIISIPEEILELKSWCSLIPIGESATVTTTGLKWNITNQEMRFGGIVSTSNTFSGESQVVVETSSTLLWSMAIRKESD